MTSMDTVAFDPINPNPWYQYMQHVNPVYFDGKWWHFFCYKDVFSILETPTLFSSNIDVGRGLSGSMFAMDPPRHRQIRGLFAQAFTPKRVAQLEGKITRIVHELIDQVIEAAEMDVINDLAFPTPTMVIAELLGIPLEDRNLFRAWSDRMLLDGQVLPVGSEEEQQLITEMYAYCHEIVVQRRQQPKDDLVTALLQAEVEGEKLQEKDIISNILLLMQAGNAATTTLMSQTMKTFDEYPALYPLLQSNPTLIPAALEEVLRYRNPVRTIPRKATEDTMIGEKKIEAGQLLLLWLGAANCDEAVFSNANTFDLNRPPHRHVAFGYHIHFCLGAPLARLEARIMLEVMTSRIFNIRRIAEIPLAPILHSNVQGTHNFPITFTPGKKL